METFAEYILAEEDFDNKVEIMYYFKNKRDIFFDPSVAYKAAIVKMFIDCMKIDVDCNLVVTAMLLCACKKVEVSSDLEKIKRYAKESAEYLETLGFSKRFCKICEDHNRYSGNLNRERESDILELANQFCGMTVDRPERTSFPIDEAIVLMEHRNLKDVTNVYLEKFKEFIQVIKEVPA
ncbi:MAG: hypothetical protein FWC68_05770 [Oscillospiraceae bacterium]|nr:hypothetical protein [Oscillospiraceae bacterium]